MRIAGGVLIVILAMVAWGGQTLSWMSPPTAVRWGLMENESDVEPAIWADIRGEARWDAFTLWTMVVAGLLLLNDQSAWPYFGLVGGGMYLYFAGRVVSTRLALRSGGFRIGSVASVRVALAASVTWGAMALGTIAAAVIDLES